NQGHVGGGLSFRGVNGVDSTIMVDGMNYHTLRGGAGGSTRLYHPNPLMFAEANMGLSAQGVEFQTSGIQMNLVPKDGGNQLSGSAIGAYTSSRFQSVNTNADLQARGLTAPPRIDHAYENGVGVGGFLVRDKLWFYGSIMFSANDNKLPGFYNATQHTPVYTP